MSDTTTPLPPITARLDHIFPNLTPAQMARIEAHGGCVRFSTAKSWWSRRERMLALGEGSIAISFVHQVLHE